MRETQRERERVDDGSLEDWEPEELPRMGKKDPPEAPAGR